jgi:hypothetical protein
MVTWNVDVQNSSLEKSDDETYSQRELTELGIVLRHLLTASIGRPFRPRFRSQVASSVELPPPIEANVRGHDLPRIVSMPIPDEINTLFKCEEELLRAEDIPVEIIPISDIGYNLDIPYLEKLGTDDWNLSPRDLIENFSSETHHAKWVNNADLQYPIEIYLFRWKRIILDWVHRFTKAVMQWDTQIKVRRVSDEIVQKTRKSNDDYRRRKWEIIE